MPSARYVYAVCRGLEESALVGVSGLDGRPVEVVGALDLQAAVSTVEVGEPGEDRLRAALEQPDRVERTARRHDAVVQACARSAPTVPMRLATTCGDDRIVRLRLEEWYDDLVAALDRTRGREEWSVKVYAHLAQRARRTQQEHRTQQAHRARRARRRRAQAEKAGMSGDPSSLAAEDVDAGLRELAVAARSRSGPDGGALLLNGAYLVDAARARAFAKRVAALGVAHPDVSVACDGPWPPYSFATLEK